MTRLAALPNTHTRRQYPSSQATPAPRQVRRRAGATTVELAFVIGIFILVLFGIIEYGRYVFVRQVVIQAAREGARYAVVNLTDQTIESDTRNYVKKKMSGLDGNTTYYQCQVYMADDDGNNIGNAGDAQFGQYVAVQVDYDFTPVLPSLLFLDSTMRVSSKALMYSEAN